MFSGHGETKTQFKISSALLEILLHKEVLELYFMWL